MKDCLHCAKITGWGFRKTLPLSKLQEKRFLEKDILIVEVYISGVEVDDGEGGVVSMEKETVDIKGFQVFASKVTSAIKIFAEHPDIAEDLKPKNQVVKTEYMSVLLNLVERLDKPSQNHPETELNIAHSELSGLMEAGFKLDWLKSKLDEVSLKRKKELDERAKSIEWMLLHFELHFLKTKFEEVSTLERKISDKTGGSPVQQLEDSVKSLEMMLSDLKVELNKAKAKSSADGFLLVDEDA